MLGKAAKFKIRRYRKFTARAYRMTDRLLGRTLLR
jgi:hypothetical protein